MTPTSQEHCRQTNRQCYVDRNCLSLDIIIGAGPVRHMSPAMAFPIGDLHSHLMCVSLGPPRVHIKKAILQDTWLTQTYILGCVCSTGLHEAKLMQPNNTGVDLGHD